MSEVKNIQIDKKIHKRVKQKALDDETSLKNIFEDIIDKELKKQGY